MKNQYDIGYNKLQSNNNLKIINHIKFNLSNTSLINKNNEFLRFFRLDHFALDLSHIQYNKVNLLQKNFNQKIIKFFYDNKKISLPLPKKWLVKLKNEKVQVNQLNSSLLWLILCIKKYLSTYHFLIKYIIFSIFTENNLKGNSNSIFLHSTNPDIFKENSFDDSILKLYENNLDRTICFQDSIKLNTSYKHIKIKYKNISLPYLNKPIFIIKLIYWLIKSHFYLLKRFDDNFLLNIFFYKEYTKAYIFLLNDSNNNHYYFNNTNSLYRPFWTYFCEQKNSSSFFYFYSLNNDSLRNDFNLPLTNWYPLTWQNYMLVDIKQKYFVEENSKLNFKINYSKIFDNFIKYKNQNNLRHFINDKYILISDITPLNDIDFFIAGEMYENYRTKYIKIFIQDILFYLNNNNYANINVILKTKKTRFVDNKNYLDFIKRQNKLIICEENISLKNLIENSMAVISYPFTTIGYLAGKMGKNSVYYDPTSSISDSHNSLYGLKLLKSREQLKNYLERNIIC